MNTTQQILDAADQFQPGTVLTIANYQSSTGSVSDLTLEILPPGGYKEMQQESLDILLEAVEDMDETEAPVAATMIAALQKSLNPPEGAAESSRKMPEYVAVGGGSLRQLDGQDAVYVSPLKSLGEVSTGDLPKGDIPRLKKEITRRLDLPVGRYVHAVKFVDGFFDSVSLKSPK